MPPVRAPSGGNIFSDIGRAGGGLISGVLERRKREEEKARQAALATERQEDLRIKQALAEAQIGSAELGKEKFAFEKEKFEFEKAQQEGIGQALIDAQIANGVDPDTAAKNADLFVKTKRFLPGMDITPPVDRREEQRTDQLEQLGFKADIKRRFLHMLAGDNVLDLTPSAFVDMADSEIKRMVSANPNADFELIQSAVIDELERTLKAFEAKKKASEQQGDIRFPVQFNREEQVLNQFTDNR